MLRHVIAARAAFALLAFAASTASAHTNAKEPHKLAWSFDGPLGKFDQRQLQRGYKVYAEGVSSRLSPFKPMTGADLLSRPRPQATHPRLRDGAGIAQYGPETSLLSPEER